MTCFLLLIKTLIKPSAPMLGTIHHQPVKGHSEDLFSGSGEQPARNPVLYVSTQTPGVWRCRCFHWVYEAWRIRPFQHYSPCRDTQTAHKWPHVVLRFNQLPSHSFARCWPVKSMCELRCQKHYKEKSCVHLFTVWCHTQFSAHPNPCWHSHAFTETPELAL